MQPWRQTCLAILCALVTLIGTCSPGSARVMREFNVAAETNAEMAQPATGLLARPGTNDSFAPRTPFGENQCGRPVMRWTFAAKLNSWLAEWHAGFDAFVNSEAILAAAFFSLAYLLGKLVRGWGLHVNYARKLLGAAMLAVPFVAATYLPYATTPISMTASFLVFLVCLGAFTKPVRDLIPFLNTAFASIDRPEDRPHTLMWFTTGFIVSSAILMAMIWWAVPSFPPYVAVALASVGIGDLLAGAVGTRFGRHKYATTALFTDKTYTRSYEGSACVFVVTLLAVLFFATGLPQGQFIASLIVLPVLMTLAEAKSPHTWDEPVMFFTAMIVSLAIVKTWTTVVC